MHMELKRFSQRPRADSNIQLVLKCCLELIWDDGTMFANAGLQKVLLSASEMRNQRSPLGAACWKKSTSPGSCQKARTLRCTNSSPAPWTCMVACFGDTQAWNWQFTILSNRRGFEEAVPLLRYYLAIAGVWAALHQKCIFEVKGLNYWDPSGCQGEEDKMRKRRRELNASVSLATLVGCLSQPSFWRLYLTFGLVVDVSRWLHNSLLHHATIVAWSRPWRLESPHI
jgi:hypothetical protein